MLPEVKTLDLILVDKCFLKWLLFALILSFIGCSSTTRLSKPDSSDAEKSRNSGTVRFTSEDNKTSSQDTLNSLSSNNRFVSEEYLDRADFEEEKLPAENIKFDPQKIVSETKLNQSEIETSPGTDLFKQKLLFKIVDYLKTPYQFGGNSKSGIDCSAFTKRIFYESLSINLNRTAREQFKQGLSIENLSDLRFGDLIFFDTRTRVKPGHVGIYLGNNLFAHASSGSGVIVSSLLLNYYAKRFMGARRIERTEESIK